MKSKETRLVSQNLSFVIYHQVYLHVTRKETLLVQRCIDDYYSCIVILACNNSLLHTEQCNSHVSRINAGQPSYDMGNHHLS